VLKGFKISSQGAKVEARATTNPPNRYTSHAATELFIQAGLLQALKQPHSYSIIITVNVGQPISAPTIPRLVDDTVQL
jgi:hypothetical protein